LFVALAAVAWSTAGLFQRELSVGVATQLAGRALFAALGLLAYIGVTEHGRVLQAFRAIGRGGIAILVRASAIQSSPPWVLRSSRGTGPLNPKWSSRVDPRCSILAEVSMDAETLACARATIAPIVAIAIATAINFRITATYPQLSRIAPG